MPLPFRLGAFYFFYFALVAAQVAYFPLYLDWRGLGAAEIALVLALPQLARIFAPAGWGWLADRTGAQRLIVAFCCTVMASSYALLAHAEGLMAIALLVGAMSVLSAGALPLVESITMASLAGAAGRYGPIRLWGSIGFIIVVLAGGASLDLFTAAGVQPALVALSLATLAACAGLPPSGPRTAPPHPAAAFRTPGQAARVQLLGAGFCMSAAHGTLYAFFTLHLQNVGYGGGAIGALWTLGVLAEIGVFFFLPYLFRRFQLGVLLVASFACAVLRFLVIGWGAEHALVLVPAQLLHGATFGVFHAASIAAVHRIFPPGAQARGQALFAAVSYGAGGAAGTLVAGAAWRIGGAPVAFSFASLVAGAGLYFAFRLKRPGL